jgi:photosystem II stability/assembly factor-like uncharacterized protein
VRFGSAQDGWVFDDGLWSTHDGGHTWTDIFLGRVLHLEAAAGTVWALTAEGSGKAQLWRSPVDDDNWVPVKGVTVDRQADLAVQGSRVIVVDADKTWVGQGEGNEFVAHPSPCDSPALQVRLSASGSLWAKCVTGMAAYVATSADGTSWQTVQPKGLDQMLPNSLTIGARGADDALLASDPAQPLFDLQSDGTQVAVSKPPTTGAHIDYLGFTTDDVGYAVVTEGLWRTDDGGDTWRKLAIG